MPGWIRCAAGAALLAFSMRAIAQNAAHPAAADGRGRARLAGPSSSSDLRREVYEIRVPSEIEATIGVKGMSSSRPDAVEVEFRVDMGIRGASVGSNHVLRMPSSTWRQGTPFALHQRAFVFLNPPETEDLHAGRRRGRHSGDGRRRHAGGQLERGPEQTPSPGDKKNDRQHSEHARPGRSKT
jgi:hypothetical protein